LSDEEQRRAAAGTALEAGRVAILISDAATVDPLGVTTAIPVADLRRAFKFNVIAPVALTAAVLSACPARVGAAWSTSRAGSSPA
jgi:NAD(P)-dependent dehydrogenase (short-subunit alcohol dehydrogenase family)